VDTNIVAIYVGANTSPFNKGAVSVADWGFLCALYKKKLKNIKTIYKINIILYNTKVNVKTQKKKGIKHAQ